MLNNPKSTFYHSVLSFRLKSFVDFYVNHPLHILGWIIVELQVMLLVLLIKCSTIWFLWCEGINTIWPAVCDRLEGFLLINCAFYSPLFFLKSYCWWFVIVWSLFIAWSMSIDWFYIVNWLMPVFTQVHWLILYWLVDAWIEWCLDWMMVLLPNALF